MADESVTHWIYELQHGSEATAQEQLWARYFRRLVALARTKLADAPVRFEDEEDVALSALDSFFEGARKNEFPLLRDRTNLWPLLAKITARKAINCRMRETAKKRGAGKVRGESVFAAAAGDDMPRGIEDVVGHEPTPEFAAAIAECCRELLNDLPDDLQQIVNWKLFGYSNAEIAAKLGRAKRTVERKLELIRMIWLDRQAAADS